MKIKLIEPARYLPNGKLLKTKELFFPSLALPYLSALTPKEINVSITMEQFEDINFEEKVDLVGITSYTSRILRAYEIADAFKKRGVSVVMGGLHTSMEPEEALEHTDTVIVGEAEETWQEFINDFRNGTQKRLYVAKERPSLANLSTPQFSLLEKYKSRFVSFQKRGLFHFLPMPVLPIQTARGCPHSCDFCSVTLFSGSQYRTRPIPDVINEIRSLGVKAYFFVDDNIFANPTRAKELFEALIPLKIMWFGQATISAARDKELIHLARRSGCCALYIGLESISQRTIESIHKKSNKVAEYEDNLKAFRKEGISVMVSMIFGFDNDELTAFKDTYNFLLKNRIPYTQWYFLTPLPGTPLLKRLKQEGRLKNNKWWLNPTLTSNPFVLKFTGLKIDENMFKKNYLSYYKKFYSIKSIIRRILLPPQVRFILKIFLNLILKKKVSIKTTIIEA